MTKVRFVLIVTLFVVIFEVLFACNSDEFECHNGECKPGSYLCDGGNDCSDNSDENYCRSGCRGRDCYQYIPTCAHDQFRCNAGTCIPKQWECDGDYDCPDLTDEHMLCQRQTCETYQFTCDNGFCLDNQLKCNGVDDCGDNSDEFLCLVISADASHNATKIMKCNEFQCKNGDCIDHNLVCNSANNCADGSDEGGQCEASCTYQTNPCHHQCSKSPSGPICTCNTGYKLAGDGITCRDSLECSKEPPVCSQLCKEEVGSYSCSCYKEFTMRADNKTCKSTAELMSIYFVVKNEIRQFIPARRMLKVIHVVEDVSNISGLDVSTNDNVIYFTVENANSVYYLNTKNDSKKHITNLNSAKNIALDWISNNVYFIDVQNIETQHDETEPEILTQYFIRVCNFNARHCAKIVHFDAGDNILALAVDGINKYIFYSVANYDSCALFRSALDGTNAHQIATRASNITEITIDYRNLHIYFSDETTISRLEYNGNASPKVEMFNTEKKIKGLNIFEDHLYFLTDFGYTMHKCRLFGDMRRCTSFRLSSNSTDQFVISQTSRQTPGRNPCINYNCSHLCVPNAFGASCLCEAGNIVDETNDCMVSQ